MGAADLEASMFFTMAPIVAFLACDLGAKPLAAS